MYKYLGTPRDTRTASAADCVVYIVRSSIFNVFRRIVGCGAFKCPVAAWRHCLTSSQHFKASSSGLSPVGSAYLNEPLFQRLQNGNLPCASRLWNKYVRSAVSNQNRTTGPNPQQPPALLRPAMIHGYLQNSGSESSVCCEQGFRGNASARRCQGRGNDRTRPQGVL